MDLERYNTGRLWLTCPDCGIRQEVVLEDHPTEEYFDDIGGHPMLHWETTYPCKDEECGGLMHLYESFRLTRVVDDYGHDATVEEEVEETA